MPEDEELRIQNIFALERTGMSPRGHVMGNFVATGLKPEVLERMKAYGVHLPSSIFTERHELKER